MTCKLIRRIAVVAVGAFFSSSGTAGELTIPNTFSSGTKALASEVNENFTAVETAVDDNDSRITTNGTGVTANANAIAQNAADIAGMGAGLRIAADGQEIGRFVTGDAAGLTVISDAGYLATVVPDGSIAGSSTMYFQTADCTGQAYAAGFVSLPVNNGFVADQGDGTIVYVPHGTPATGSFTYGSYFTAGVETKGGEAGVVCSAVAGTATDVYATQTNDPAVTGVENAYALPLQLMY